MSKEIQDLLKYSSSEIKGDKALYSEFVRLYLLNGGKESDCKSCNFQSTYSRWKRKYTQPIKPHIMGNGKKTFKLHDESFLAHVLEESWVFSNKSDDETALRWINQFEGKYKEVRESKFSKLPEVVEAPKKRRKKTSKK